MPQRVLAIVVSAVPGRRTSCPLGTVVWCILMLYDLFWKCLYTHSLVCKVTSVLVANKRAGPVCVCCCSEMWEGQACCGSGRVGAVL